MIKLGVNIDHVATVRQARREKFPSVVEAALAAVAAGAQGITAHLREDRRHIQDQDLFDLKKALPVPLNMEMSADAEIVEIARDLKPAWCCLVPEKRQELTTEGGLDLKSNEKAVKSAIEKLHGAGTQVSLFVDANLDSIRRSKEYGADAVELHTGRYADAWSTREKLDFEKEKLKVAAEEARASGLIVNAGHGINYENAAELAALFPFNEFNIGFAIVARALLVGMGGAVQEMKKRISI